MPAQFAVKIVAVDRAGALFERLVILAAGPGALLAHPLDNIIHQAI